MTHPDQFDRYLTASGPAALVLREQLMPVEGTDGVLFPATFAAGGSFPGGYNIDGSGSESVCLVDSAGSQANRIEPIFLLDGYRALVPQIVVTTRSKGTNLLEVGHRAGDALVRCSSLQPDIEDAFQAELAGDCEPLAKIAPTSLVFGVWDSRKTQSKRPRLVTSTIRAYNVRKLTRGAVYTPPVNYSELEVFSEEDKAKAEGNNKSPLAQRGFVHNPASAAHGGVIADGGIRRDATLGLAALRHIRAGSHADRTLALRRYILGLALVSFTAPAESYLRQGCTLVLNPSPVSGQPREFVEVYPDGTRTPCTLTHEVALSYAVAVAEAFVVGKDRTVPFEEKLAREDLKDKEAKGKDKSKGKAGSIDSSKVDS